MPNWVTNVVNISGDEAECNRIRERLRTEAKKEILDDGTVREVKANEFDFNNIIPKPSSLEMDECSPIMEQSIILYLDTLTNKDACISSAIDRTASRNKITSKNNFLTSLVAEDFPERVKEAKDVIRKHIGDSGDFNSTLNEYISNGKQYFENILNYGYPTWYGWSNANWGCKWNSTDSSYDEKTGSYTFLTAWGAPHPIIEQIASESKDVSIVHAWADEDLGYNCGINQYYCSDCSYTSKTYIPREGSPEAFILAGSISDIPVSEVLMYWNEVNQKVLERSSDSDSAANNITIPFLSEFL